MLHAESVELSPLHMTGGYVNKECAAYWKLELENIWVWFFLQPLLGWIIFVKQATTKKCSSVSRNRLCVGLEVQTECLPLTHLLLSLRVLVYGNRLGCHHWCSLLVLQTLGHYREQGQVAHLHNTQFTLDHLEQSLERHVRNRQLIMEWLHFEISSSFGKLG